MEICAGIAIIFENSILLVHPTNSGWSRLGIPKGRLEKGEPVQDAAIRETFEETGIKIDSSRLEKNAFFLDYPNKRKRVFYYLLRINSLDEIGLSTPVVPKGQLQLEEVDWAGFVPFTKALKMMYKPQHAIIKRMAFDTNEMLNFKEFFQKVKNHSPE